MAVSFLSGDLVTGHDPWLVGEWHGIVLLNVTASGVRYELSQGCQGEIGQGARFF